MWLWIACRRSEGKTGVTCDRTAHVTACISSHPFLHRRRFVAASSAGFYRERWNNAATFPPGTGWAKEATDSPLKTAAVTATCRFVVGISGEPEEKGRGFIYRSLAYLGYKKNTVTHFCHMLLSGVVTHSHCACPNTAAHCTDWMWQRTCRCSNSLNGNWQNAWFGDTQKREKRCPTTRELQLFNFMCTQSTRTIGVSLRRPCVWFNSIILK